MQVVNRILTLQTYKWCGSPKFGQILFFEDSFQLGIEERRVSTGVKSLVFELEIDLTLELVILGKNCYHRNYKDPLITIFRS
jgi:hypothetical protein